MSTYTNVTRVTGLATGMDIDSMVDQLMSAESAKYERLQQEQTWLTWQQEAYRSVISQLQDFQSKWFGSSTNLRYSSSFNSYTTSVLNSSGMSSNAIKVNSYSGTSSCTISVEQVAVSESFTSTSSISKGITTSSQATEIASTISTSEGAISLTFSLDGTSKSISITKEDIETYKTTDNQSSSIDDVDALVGVLNEKLKSAFGTEFSDEGEAKVSVSKNDDGTLTFNTTTGHTLTITNDSTNSCSKFGITSGATNTTTGTTTLGEAFGSALETLIQDEKNKGKDDDALTLKLGDTTISITSDDTIDSLVQKINSSGAFTISYNELGQTFTISANEGGASNGIEISDDFTKTFLNDCLKINVDDKTNGYVAGQDAIITIDGVRTTRTSNDIEYNGLSFSITEAAEGQTFTISVEQDVDSVFNMISDFVEDYNSLIKELNSLISETRAKDDTYGYYEPLTDSQKEGMTEDEIEKWETQAKTGLLYNDTYISSILSSLRSCLYSSVKTSSGESIALYTIGITTSSDYTTNGQLVIDEEKLREAISKDPEAVRDLFTQTDNGLADQVYDILQGAIGTNGSLRTKAGIENTSSVNENLISKELSELAERIAAEKERLANKEERYYSLFSSMESAITQQNSQLEALTQLLA